MADKAEGRGIEIGRTLPLECLKRDDEGEVLFFSLSKADVVAS